MSVPDRTIFYLNGFNYDIISSSLADISANDTAPSREYNATCQMDLKLSIANHMFQFQINFTDNVDDNIKYNFQIPSVATGFNLATTHNPGNALMTDGNQDSTAADTLKNDWLKYLAFKIFGSHLAIDLISNEEEVRDSIMDESVLLLMEKFEAIIAYQEEYGSNVPANESGTSERKALIADQLSGTNSNMGPSKQILDQITKNYPERLDPYLYSTYLNPVPLKAGDTIAFIMSVAANTNQLLDFGMSGVIADRIYLVKMAIVADIAPN